MWGVGIEREAAAFDTFGSSSTAGNTRCIDLGPIARGCSYGPFYIIVKFSFFFFIFAHGHRYTSLLICKYLNNTLFTLSIKFTKDGFVIVGSTFTFSLI